MRRRWWKRERLEKYEIYKKENCWLAGLAKPEDDGRGGRVLVARRLLVGAAALSFPLHLTHARW